MFCPKCGAQNTDQVYHCATCGSPIREAQSFGSPPPDGGVFPPAEGYAPEKPANWLAPAILATLFCACQPFGIVAIVFAAQVDGKYAAGDYAGAQAAANKARLFTILTALIGPLCIGTALVLNLLGVLAALLRGAGL